MLLNMFPTNRNRVLTLIAACLMTHVAQRDAAAQAPPEPPKQPVVEIPTEHRSIDPSTLIPPALSTKATVKFEAQPLKDVLAWVAKAQSLSVIVDQKALASAKILDSDPVSDELANEPLYLLLNRLVAVGVRWYVEDGLLRITSMDDYQTRVAAVSYNLGSLIDAGYESHQITRAIKQFVGDDSDQLEMIADVAFVRQTPERHYEIAGLLEALRNPMRRTLTFDPPQNEKVRAAMEERISVEFEETPLVVALQELSTKAKIRIQLDHHGTIRERVPVSLKMYDQKLQTILQSILSGHSLTWAPKDGVLYVLRSDAIKHFFKTAVYDVRDLCADEEEARGLKRAILYSSPVKQTGDGSIDVEMPKTGVLVVKYRESLLNEISDLLENYRTALKASKERPPKSTDPNEVVVGFYRLPEIMVGGVREYIVRSIQPDSWRDAEHSDRVGTILAFTVDPSVFNASGIVPSQFEKTDSNAIILHNQVLMIRQTRATHEQIGKLIQDLMTSTKVDASATPGPTPDRTLPFGSSLIQKQGK